MQLDKTQILVRERGVFDILDLALHVFRIHLIPLCITTLIGAAPWAVINYLLIGWMVPSDLDAPESPTAVFFRYVWTMTVLVCVQAPFASAFSTVYLGKALFIEQPTLRQVCREVLAMMSRLIWYHVLLRGILPTICLVIAINRDQLFSGSELLLILLFIAVMLRRGTAPFLNEIVLLERNPLRSSDPNEVTIRKRSVMLHGPASGPVLSLALVVALYVPVLFGGLAGALQVLQGVLLGQWQLSGTMMLVGWPVAMWMTTAFVTVVRFLSYLDLRIRHEGWEVELRIRAEANRLAESLR